MSKSLTNKLGVHALVWAGNTSDQEIDRAVRKTASAGYDLLELSLHDLENLNVERTAKLLRDSGLSVVCSRGLAFDADVSSSDIATVERGALLLQDSLKATVDLGGKLFTGALYSALGKYSQALTPAGEKNAIGVIRELAQVAAQDGVTLGIEICNRYETNVINTAEQALRFVDKIGADNVVIHLDTYHMNIEENDLVQPVHLVGERLGYVHIGENQRGYLGSGHINFPSFFHALEDTGYKGPITFESFSSKVVARGLSNDLAIWRDTWRDGEDLAKHALQFLNTYLTAGQ